MEYSIMPPTHVSASIGLPASKSISNRVLIIDALAGGGSDITNIALCDDTTVMKQSLEHDAKSANEAVTDVHGAGTAMRFLTAYYALRGGTHVMTGSERMRRRPVNILVDALRSLGAKIEYLGIEGCPPLHITSGKLRGGRVELPAGVSSQYISALLMIAPKLPGGLELKLTGTVTSRPYIDMTLALMNEFGARAAWTAPDTITVSEGGYVQRAYKVENDWSAASYWYETVLLSHDAEARVLLSGLTPRSLQGDRRVAAYFDMLGVATRFTDSGAVIEKKGGTPCGRLELDLHGEPDLAQTLVVACAVAGTHFAFSGLANLRIKETDRIAALTAELRKLGYVLRSDGSGSVSWDGERCGGAEQPVICTYDDHRMAMSFAPVCLRTGSITVADPGVVAKSYPGFWNDLAAAGFTVNKL